MGRVSIRKLIRDKDVARPTHFEWVCFRRYRRMETRNIECDQLSPNLEFIFEAYRKNRIRPVTHAPLDLSKAKLAP